MTRAFGEENVQILRFQLSPQCGDMVLSPKLTGGLVSHGFLILGSSVLQCCFIRLLSLSQCMLFSADIIEASISFHLSL